MHGRALGHPRAGPWARIGGRRRPQVQDRTPVGQDGRDLAGPLEQAEARPARRRSGPVKERPKVRQGIDNGMAQADEGHDGVSDQQEVQGRVGHVFPNMVAVGLETCESSQSCQEVRGDDEEQRGHRPVPDLGGPGEGRLGRRYRLHQCCRRPGQVYRHQQEVETIKTRYIEPFVAAVAQVRCHGPEIGQGQEPQHGADQGGIERKGQQDEQAGRAPGDRRHVVPTQEPFGEAHTLYRVCGRPWRAGPIWGRSAALPWPSVGVGCRASRNPEAWRCSSGARGH